MGEKNSHNNKKTIMRGWPRMGQDLKETLLRSSKSENDDENHHRELLRHSGIKNNREVEPMMKRI